MADTTRPTRPVRLRPPLNITLSLQSIACLDQLAAREMRSRSNMIEALIARASQASQAVRQPEQQRQEVAA